MLITDKLIYLELQKTGCTHTLKILSELFKDNYTIVGKHNTYDAISKRILGDFNNKQKIGNIRNPWDWYVSLWAFGCQNNGELFVRLTTKGLRFINNEGIKVIANRVFTKSHSRIDPEIWKKLYADPNNKENFREWLRLILLEPNHYIGEHYKSIPLSNFAGFLTHRYLRLYTNRKGMDIINSKEALLEYDKMHNFMDLVIRNETIHQELLENIDLIGGERNKLVEILNKYQTRTNKSTRERDYRFYYDAKSVDCVLRYDSFLIDKYNYSFE